MKEITILTFNYGIAGKYVNGPGMCLVNFVSILKRNFKGLKINIFSKLPSGKQAGNFFDRKTIMDAIKRSDVVHHWSGTSREFSSYCQYAKNCGAKVLVGPNVLDGVEFENEKKYLSYNAYDHIFVVNERLRFLVSKLHMLPISKMSVLMIGPDLEMWTPSYIKTDEILWKGNGSQFVKDVKMGLEISKRLKKYKFNFIGYPKPYHYLQHIERAKQAKLYITTSLSETMGLAMAEQWASGVPSVSHPKIYMHGENYKTGIITNRTVEDYCEAVEEIMENKGLHKRLSDGAYEYSRQIFSDENILANYMTVFS